jgi:hypothetical protein
MRIDNAGTTTLTSAATTAPFIAKISTSEAARIDSSGRFLVGTSTARSNFANTTTVAPFLQLEGTAFNQSALSLTRNSANALGAGIIIGKTRGTSIGSNTALIANDGIGGIGFEGADGTNLVAAAAIEARVDGTPGAGAMPGRLVFSTTASGASSPTERMRIVSDGTVMIGKTTIGNGEVNVGILQFGSNGRLGVTSDASHSWFSRTTNDGDVIRFHRGTTTGVGSISVTTTATAYNTSSDYRLKENVVPLTGAIDRLQQIPVHRFNFIADPDTAVDGFIAHEAQAIVPECVTGTKDEVDEDGNPVYQGIDQSKLVPLLTAALQEALQKIEDLEGRLTAAGL